MKYIDHFLDRITMYRLVLYYLIVLLGVAVVYSYLHILMYPVINIGISIGVLLSVSWITDRVFAWAFKAPTNFESVYITVCILALIITPINAKSGIVFLGWAAVWGVASKYIFAIGKKHIFNPVAIAVVLTSFGFGQSASWWVGNAWMMPFVVVGGLLIVRKIRREDLVWSFFFAALVTISLFTVLNGGDLFSVYQKVALHSSLFFLAFVMLTEPLTTPPTKKLQILYGGLVGILFAPQIHFFGIYSTPELALVIGNIFSYIVSPKQKLILQLKEKIKVSEGVLDFIFTPHKKMTFVPGQYMEWTLPHKRVDSRGNRRYFTIASSPTEDHIRLGAKFYNPGSSYKKELARLDDKTPMVAAQLAGDFTLPNNKGQKLVFVAGGIGVTPFRSMIKYLIDKNEKRDVILFYANKTADEIAYREVFDEAQKKLGIKTVYTVTDKNALPSNWQGRVGRIDAQMIQDEVPDYLERVFYLSGPQALVSGLEKILSTIGVKKKQIKKDYFPGLV
ncbi:MAG TPA: RnfABCDGE type electron transport complex subunit D [Candidatus Saccharimonadales bacterium]|nr:RnfABCDGE type electron transport complex subunit D [Candidatus Saccharimonadales bacterium]